jgi:hypothetical protein
MKCSAATYTGTAVAVCTRRSSNTRLLGSGHHMTYMYNDTPLKVPQQGVEFNKNVTKAVGGLLQLMLHS